MIISGGSVRALIFDFDGVLADTEELHWAAFRSVAGEIGADLPRDVYYSRMLGLPDRECLAAIGTSLGRQLEAKELENLVARKRARYRALAAEAALYPGVAPLLTGLAPHFILAVASGAFRDEIEDILGRQQVLDLFTVVIAAEDVRAGKPAPDPFLTALSAINARRGLRLQAADCVVVEDSPNGVAAARAAGMRCIGVTTSHPASTLEGADHVITNVAQLRAADLLLG